MLKSRMTRSIIIGLLTLILLSSLGLTGAADQSLEGEIILLHAGSLAVPVDNLKEAFHELYPNIEVKNEAGGSNALCRQVSELGKNVDILMSADYVVIDELLMPDYADFNIAFAVNSLVIMYTNDSRYAEEINADNWYEILLRDGVDFGHSEPDMDPCGYRSVLLFQLAENYYKKEGLDKALRDAIPQKNIRPKSVELIALLETGALDYAFEYESVAMQHEAMDSRFKYVRLPDAINLSSLDYADDYAKATIELTGPTPETPLIVNGEPIVYSLTMPVTGENRENAIVFLRFLFNPEQGLKVLQESGQPVIEVRAASGGDKVPAELADLVK